MTTFVGEMESRLLATSIEIAVSAAVDTLPPVTTSSEAPPSKSALAAFSVPFTPSTVDVVL